MERAYRFLDPATADPRAPLDRSLATHVAICALRGEPPAEIATRYPFATLLMDGQGTGLAHRMPDGRGNLDPHLPLCQRWQRRRNLSGATLAA